jgi:thiamine-monophosphate kinase
LVIQSEWDGIADAGEDAGGPWERGLMSADEFDIIRDLFAPLATDAAARGLRDDAALLDLRGPLVVTTDAIVEGVHFLPNDPIATIAKKALRVNLSDLAAKGARPVGALLTLIWPNHRPAAEIAEFARALGEDLRQYGLALWGGDTSSTPGPLTVSMTLFGAPSGARTPARTDAVSGQDLWLSGPVGDSYLGLIAAKRGDAGPVDAIGRYRVPEPRTDCAVLIAAHAGAAMDVSDGLIADAHKLAHASGVALRIEAAAVPLSAAAQAALVQGVATLADLFAGGDDYELLFTAAPAVRDQLLAAGMHRIGRVESGEGVAVFAADGSRLTFASAGFSHRLGC